MFDLTPPVFVSKCYGNSIIRIGSHFESCQIYKDKAMSPCDFVKLWLGESSSLCRHMRKLGLLATQVERDEKGRLGCIAGWILLVDDDIVVVHDATIGLKEFEYTFEYPPDEWWRCIKANRSWLRSDWRMSLKDLIAWNEILNALSHSMVFTKQLIEEERRAVSTNRRLVGTTLSVIQGGSDLYAIFPRDYMKRMRFIGSSVYTDFCGLGGWAGVQSFRSEVAPCRSVRALSLWVRSQTSIGNGTLVFLRQVSGEGIYCSHVRVKDANEEVLQQMVDDVKLPFQAVDVVAFLTRGNFRGSFSGSGRITKDSFGELLGRATNVILGVCNGTAWVTFPVL